MMAARRKRKTGKPPEENRTRGKENIVKEKERTSQPVVEVVENGGNEQKSSREKVSDFPFRETVKLPNLENTVKSNAGFQNKAPLQADERARDLLIEFYGCGHIAHGRCGMTSWGRSAVERAR